MRSRIYARDKIVNAARKFGAAPHWFYAEFIVGGRAYPCAFTAKQVSVALQRMVDNPEDVPPQARSLWQRLRGWMGRG